ncbi:MAG: hypothetical protein K0S33_1605 [Bacteroidetes bacterium]|jgi:hypothetical protein|nr:hypothetical protein [Bacteroidota bacterium]
MKNGLNVIVVLLLLTGLSSCGIGIPKGKENYVGMWTSETMTLNIDENGKVEYKRQVTDVSSKSVNGPIQKFDGDNFVVGALGIETTFVVSKPPHEEEGTIKMTVDGIELTKQ